MTNKIPVGATVAHSYRFAFSNYLNNLGAAWMPLVLMFIALYYFIPPYVQLITSLPVATPGQDAAARVANAQESLRLMGALAPMLFFAGLVSFICVMSASVGVTKEALGLRSGSAFFQFPFGKPVWRVLGALLLLALILVAVEIALIVVVVIATIAGAALLKGASAGIGAAVGALAVIGLLVAYIYCALRVVFLLVPVVIAEERVSIKRGWQLARGNVWRIIMVLLAVLLPFIILEFACFYAVMGPDLFASLPSGAAAAQEISMRNRQAIAAVAAAAQSHWYVAFPVGLFVHVLVMGVTQGASAFAYRALTSTPAEEF